MAPDLMARRFLVKMKVPYDVAYSLSDQDVMVECIAYGILEGNEWDWQSMSWKERRQ
jgi:hypothetical protein